METRRVYSFDIGAPKGNHTELKIGEEKEGFQNMRSLKLSFNYVNFNNVKIIIQGLKWLGNGAEEPCPYTTPYKHLLSLLLCPALVFLIFLDAAETTRQGGPGLGVETPGF